MTGPASTKTMTEAVAYFEDADALQGAIDELQSTGFDRAGLGRLTTIGAAFVAISAVKPADPG